RDEATEQLRVDGFLDDECLALPHPREPRIQVLSLGLVQSDGRAELHAYAAPRGVVERAVGERDGGQMIHPVARGEEREEITCERRHSELRRDVRRRT